MGLPSTLFILLFLCSLFILFNKYLWLVFYESGNLLDTRVEQCLKVIACFTEFTIQQENYSQRISSKHDTGFKRGRHARAQIQNPKPGPRGGTSEPSCVPEPGKGSFREKSMIGGQGRPSHVLETEKIPAWLEHSVQNNRWWWWEKTGSGQGCGGLWKPC